MQRERKAKKIVKRKPSYDVKVMFDFQVLYMYVAILILTL